MNNLNIKECLLKKYPEYSYQIKIAFNCTDNPKLKIKYYKNLFHSFGFYDAGMIFDIILKEYNNINNMKG